MTPGPRTRELIEAGSGPLGPRPSLPPGPLADLLRVCNGWYGFESALHVLASGEAPGERVSLEAWNDAAGWRSAYGDAADGLAFFAEDVLGMQFALRGEAVCTFDPETGEVAPFAEGVEGWADLVLSDYALHTGWPLARDWQERHGPLARGDRLVPVMPFVLGGAFEVGNLHALDATEGMRLRADLAAQLRDLPDGTPVRYRVVP